MLLTQKLPLASGPLFATTVNSGHGVRSWPKPGVLHLLLIVEWWHERLYKGRRLVAATQP